MLENKCFCEKCNKIQEIKVKSYTESKDFNIGKLTYEKLYGICMVCKNEVYSFELTNKNNITLSKKIKEFEDETTILRIIKNSKNKRVIVGKDDEGILREIENIFKNKS